MCTLSGYSGDNGAATLARLLAPTAISLDGTLGYWVADSGNDAVRYVFSATQTQSPSQSQTQSTSPSQSITQTQSSTQSGSACYSGVSLLSTPAGWAFGGSAVWSASGSPNGEPGVALACIVGRFIHSTSGSSSIAGVRLTNNTKNQGGTALLSTRRSVWQGFSVSFDIQFGSDVESSRCAPARACLRSLAKTVVSSSDFSADAVPVRLVPNESDICSHVAVRESGGGWLP